jgi:GrpB-like predicted nucleotidyltransferase (UPF0157 family)/GNAT superfamily N-acetyltransferase
MKEIKKIEVVPYNSNWPKLFELEAAQIKKVLGNICTEVHHIGSTSVPGLAAKPKIDIIAVVKDHPSKTITKLETIGFDYRGEYNIPMRYFFRTISVNLHVYQERHPEIELNLTFRDYLRNHPKLRNEYAALKTKLLENKASFEKNNLMFTGYNLGKDSFIRKVLRLAGFQQLRFVRCMHFAEWDFAKKIRQKYFLDKLNMTDPYEWTFNHPDHIHFVLYIGIDVIGYAHIQLLTKLRTAIRIIAIEEKERNKGFGKQFLIWIETWLKWQGYLSIYAESSSDMIHFYE